MYFPSEQDDATLVKRTLAGDQAAFEGLVQRYQKVLYTVALRMLGNPDDAKDATQTAFVRAYEKGNLMPIPVRPALEEPEEPRLVEAL